MKVCGNLKFGVVAALFIALCMALFIQLNPIGFSPSFGVPAFASDETPYVVRCKAFLRETRFFKRNLRLFRFNTVMTDRLIDEISGVQFIGLDSPIEAPAEKTDKDEKAAPCSKKTGDPTLRKVLDWFDRYAAYPVELDRLERSLGRFWGEDPVAIRRRQGSTQEGVEESGRDGEDDSIRRLGRVRILEQAIARVEAAQRKKAEDPNFEPGKGEAFPLTLVFPRATRREKDQVILQRFSSILNQKTFTSLKDLKDFLENDLKEVGKLQGLLVAREIEQAELFVRIRKFHQSFPPGAYEKLQDRIRRSDEKRQSAQAQGKTLYDPRQDPQFAGDYAIVDLFQRASDFLSSHEDQFLVLRPSARSLDFIESLLGQASGNKYFSFRSFEPAARRYVQWSYDWMAAINKYVGLFKQPIVTWGGVLVISSALNTGLKWSYQRVVRPTHDYLVYNPEEVKKREYVDSLFLMRTSISDVAVTYKDFYEKFRDYAQAHYSDEAVTVAFEYLKGVRKKPEANPQLDPGFTEAQYASFSRQAHDIVERHHALLFGYQSPFGNIPAVAPRLERRGHNFWLAEELANAEIRKSRGSNNPGDPEPRSKVKAH